MEHVLWAGGEGEDPRAAIEDIGGTTNAGTLRDFTRYYAAVPAGEWKPALQALAALVLKPSYTEGTVTREKDVVEEELLARGDNPRALLLDFGFATVYDRHPYGRPLEGTGASRTGLRKADLDAFYETWYGPNNLSVVVTGRVDPEAVVAEVKRLFGELPPRPVPPRTWAAVARPAPGTQVSIGTSGEDTYLLAAFVGPAFTEPADVCASDLLTTLLANPSRGRLTRELRDRRGLTKSLGVEFLTQRDRALFGVWAVCAPSQATETKRVLQDELRRLAQEPVPARELAAAVRLTAAGFILANQTPAERATTLAFYDSLGDYRETELYLTRLRAVRADDIQRVARWYSGDPVWATLGPKEHTS